MQKKYGKRRIFGNCYRWGNWFGESGAEFLCACQPMIWARLRFAEASFGSV
jgi:hypothetical protein